MLRDLHGKNDFAKIQENNLRIISDDRNNYVD